MLYLRPNDSIVAKNYYLSQCKRALGCRALIIGLTVFLLIHVAGARLKSARNTLDETNNSSSTGTTTTKHGGPPVTPESITNQWQQPALTKKHKHSWDNLADYLLHKADSPSEGDSIDTAARRSARGLFSNLFGITSNTSLALDLIREQFFQKVKYSRRFTPRDCMVCRFSVSVMHYAILTSRGREKVQQIAKAFCVRSKWESELVCDSITRLFREEVVQVLAYAFVTPDQMCGLLSDNQCGHFNDPLADWTISLEASEHLDLGLLHQYGLDEHHHQLAANDATQARPYRVIHISDIHVDLNYLAGSLSICNEPLCCQASSTPVTGQLNRIDGAMEHNIGFQQSLEYHDAGSGGRAGYWGSYSHCDIPLRTFQQLLIQLNYTLEAANNNKNGSADSDNNYPIDYILWTGDIQAHDVWKQDHQSALRTYDAVFDLVQRYLPHTLIFPTLGNHEMVPVDSFASSNLWEFVGQSDDPRWLYAQLDRYWSRWLPSSSETSILKDGNYAATVRPGLKVVSLNTNYCNSKNFWLYINSTDPGNQLQWLVHELQLSEILGEKVHILGHIPPGADDCLRSWSKNFNRVIRRYKRTVTAQFYGHTHNSEFQIFYDIQKLNVGTDTRPARSEETGNATLLGDADPRTNELIDAPLVANSEPTRAELLEAAQVVSVEPISVGFIGPSATSFVGLNPSYRIYTVNPLQGFLPVDFHTYYLNLTASNAQMASAHADEALTTSPPLNRTSTTPTNRTARAVLPDERQIEEVDPETLDLLLDNSTWVSGARHGDVVSAKLLNSTDLNSTNNVTAKRDKVIEKPVRLEWVHGGSFAQTFNIPDVSPASLHRLITKIGKSLRTKDHVSESLKTLLARMAIEEDQQPKNTYSRAEWEKAHHQHEDLYKLYRLFYSFSDLFGAQQYAKCDEDCRRLFLCRYLTGESHNTNICVKYVRDYHRTQQQRQQ